MDGFSVFLLTEVDLSGWMRVGFHLVMDILWCIVGIQLKSLGI